MPPLGSAPASDDVRVTVRLTLCGKGRDGDSSRASALALPRNNSLLAILDGSA
ncbi:uncharacterized protein SOCE836_043690 [Sorangium cellulosum]|uniref:Uncharacterized protein n=1 Tax=Sorangium cellulosum TaxID=56 RepID=A0A4V0NG79_SORCE|nr:uncharacterized protein SOCE836_043690 [Sorangium cellulosum]WCQ91604.1 hypothetical protein NQZ70_04326 [Sorangium sp. Soce836]